MKRQTKLKGLTLMGPKDYERNDNSRREQTHKAAFTLIELIVVMAVIGILVLLAAPKFLGYTERAQETKHIYTAKVIETALEAYLINGGAFPDDLEVVDRTSLEDAAGNEILIGVNGYVTTIDDEIYYELTYDFIQKLDVKLSTKNELFMEALASSVPTAVYASGKGIAMIDIEKTLKGYELQPGEIPNEINPNDVEQLAAGNNHSLALISDGTVMAWGYNEYGQLGDGTTQTRIAPVLVEGLDGSVKALTARGNHSLVLMNDGSVKAWGYNNYGQLGDGTTSNKSTPVTIEGLIDVKEIKAGSNHSFALMNDGTVKAWGNNAFGQLGDGTKMNRTKPVTIVSLAEVKTLTIGGNHSLALLNDGTVMAWGNNGVGQLGDGTKTSRITPQTIPGLTGVKDLMAGTGHSLALMNDDSVKAWGYNNYGQLGDGTTSDKSTPVTIEGLINVKELEAGWYHSLALMDDGTVKAWGHNDYGQLGDGSVINRLAPKVINLSGAKEIAVGNYHSLAIMEDGTVMSWGTNDQGQLGQSNQVNLSTPTLIPNFSLK